MNVAVQKTPARQVRPGDVVWRAGRLPASDLVPRVTVADVHRSRRCVRLLDIDGHTWCLGPDAVVCRSVRTL